MSTEFTFKLTDNQWNQVKHYFPVNLAGRTPKYTNREILDCIIYILKVGCQWRTLTQLCKIPWQTIYYRFNLWKQQNIYEQIFQKLAFKIANKRNLSMDSTSIKVHQSSNGYKTHEEKSIGRSVGGLTTKLHTIVDSNGIPLTYLLSPGNTNDSYLAIDLLSTLNIKDSNILADKAYTSKYIRYYIEFYKATYTIPPKSNTKNKWSFNKETYKLRHKVECFFQRIKWFRRIATRYDKLDQTFISFVYIASMILILKDKEFKST